MMNYRGFLGHVKYDDEAKIFHGEIIETTEEKLSKKA